MDDKEIDQGAYVRPIKDLCDDEHTFLADVPLSATMDPEEYAHQEKKALFKLDMQIVPLCLMLYFLSFLDRTNIAQAKLNGLQTQLNLSEYDYTLALVVLYPPYILFEIPSNLLIKRIGPSRWIPLLVCLWGLVSTLQGIVKSRDGLLINRAFLGLAEAGILPGIAVYLTFFYKPRELQLRQALFFCGASLSGAFSGLLAAAINKMSGMKGLQGWSWIFILEGIFTVIFGFCCLFLLPNNIATTWWLTPVEKQIITERLASSSNRFQDRPELDEKLAQVQMDAAHEAPVPMPNLARRDMLRALLDPSMLLMCAASFCGVISLYSISYFSPTIIKVRAHG